jgi:hypothetical protein
MADNRHRRGILNTCRQRVAAYPEYSGKDFAMTEIIIGFIIIFELVAWWTLFDKAGFPGWAAIVPFYNLYILCKVADKSGAWVLLLLIPFVSVVFWILLYIAIAQNFNKGTGFMLGMIFLPFIFVPILAFGDSSYLTVAGSQNNNSVDPGQFAPMTTGKTLSWRS